MKLADSVMAGKTSEGSIKWQLCYDISARTWWMVSWHNIFFFLSFFSVPPFSSSRRRTFPPPPPVSSSSSGFQSVLFPEKICEPFGQFVFNGLSGVPLADGCSRDCRDAEAPLVILHSSV